MVCQAEGEHSSFFPGSCAHCFTGCAGWRASSLESVSESTIKLRSETVGEALEPEPSLSLVPDPTAGLQYKIKDEE